MEASGPEEEGGKPQQEFAAESFQNAGSQQWANYEKAVEVGV